MSYSLTVRVILGFLVVYFSIGAYLFFVYNTDEAFPFFTWALFRSVPQRIDTKAAIRILEENGIALPKEDAIAKAKVYMKIGQVDNINYWLREYVRTIQVIDSAATTIARSHVEAGFMAPTKYQLFHQTIDTIEYWKTGNIVHEELIGTFTSH